MTPQLQDAAKTAQPFFVASFFRMSRGTAPCGPPVLLHVERYTVVSLLDNVRHLTVWMILDTILRLSEACCGKVPHASLEHLRCWQHNDGVPLACNMESGWRCWEWCVLPVIRSRDHSHHTDDRHPQGYPLATTQMRSLTSCADWGSTGWVASLDCLVVHG